MENANKVSIHLRKSAEICERKFWSLLLYWEYVKVLTQSTREGLPPTSKQITLQEKAA